MRQRVWIIAIGVLALLIVAVAIWLILSRPKPTGPAIAPPPEATEEVGQGVINLYLADPTDLSEVTERVELTLLKAEAIRSGGKAETIFEGSTRAMIQRGRSEKVLSVPVPSGKLSSLRLTFSPVATGINRSGVTETLYVERREVAVVLEREMPLGRTMLGAIRLPIAGAFTIKNGVPALTLPERVSGEFAVIGGLLIGDAGRLFETQGADLNDLARIEYQIDLSAIGRPGSTPITPPPSGAPR